MKKTFLLVAVVLLCAAWMFAQQPGSTSQAPAGTSQSSSQTSSPSAQSPSSSMPSSGSAGQTTSPSSSSTTPSSSGAPSPADGEIIQGCLGGAAPDYTVTDSSGNVYKLLVPASSQNVQILNSHLGESVQVQGTVGGGSGSSANSATPSSAGTPSTSASSTSSATGSSSSASTGGSQRTIQVKRMAPGTGTCSANGAKPPSK